MILINYGIFGSSWKTFFEIFMSGYAKWCSTFKSGGQRQKSSLEKFRDVFVYVRMC